MKVTGAQALFKSLEGEGVDIVFGIPGGAILPAYDPLLDSSVRHVLCRHEQGAGHAAEGYAWATGKVGVAMATSGPGGCNLVTALADAKMDSVPMVAITGQVPTPVVGNDAFQEADITGITMPVTKHNMLVTDPGGVAEAIREAFHIARTGRPGPVLVDLPKDVLVNETTWRWPDDVSLPGYKPTTKGNARQISEAAKLIMRAKRPVLYVGGGVIKADASKELFRLATSGQLPVVTTLMARGAFPDSHELCLGMPGMHGNYTAVTAMQKADLLIALGSRFDDRVTGKVGSFAPDAKIIHVDIDPVEIGKNRAADLPIVGNLGPVLEKMNAVLAELAPSCKARRAADRLEWKERIASWAAEHPLAPSMSSTEIKPQHLVREIDRLSGGDAIVCSDVGQHQMWGAQYLRFNRPRLWLSSGGLGSMGFGLPSAIGAQIANPGALVFALVGDGGFQMSIPELATVANHRLPIKIVVMNNGYLGMVRQWQELFYNNRLSSVALPGFPDASMLAGAYGFPGRTVEDPGEIGQALDDAVRHPGPYLLNVKVSPFECVYPMVPAGAAIDEMVLGPPKAVTV